MGGGVVHYAKVDAGVAFLEKIRSFEIVQRSGDTVIIRPKRNNSRVFCYNTHNGG